VIFANSSKFASSAKLPLLRTRASSQRFEKSGGLAGACELGQVRTVIFEKAALLSPRQNCQYRRFKILSSVFKKSTFQISVAKIFWHAPPLLASIYAHPSFRRNILATCPSAQSLCAPVFSRPVFSLNIWRVPVTLGHVPTQPSKSLPINSLYLLAYSYVYLYMPRSKRRTVGGGVLPKYSNTPLQKNYF
jgi:hypothetical protein